MLTITDLQFAFGTRTLFEGASAQLAKGWKVGLIGRNGTGKSTLLRLIREAHTTKEKDTAIRFNEGATLGWVAQEVAATDETILDVVLKADAERHALMEESETATDPDRIGYIHERLLDIDAWSGEARASEVLMGLGFTPEDLYRPTREFSGGWRMRAAIAGVLFAQPDVLMLDEPTNYLDLEGAAWLEGYLRSYPNTVLLVSHDREMLNACVTHTLAVEFKNLTLTTGGYDDYLKMRAIKLAQLESMKKKQDAERAHLQSFVDRFRAKASKATQAQSRIKMIEKMKDIAIPVSERTTPFHFSAPESQLAPPLLELRGADLGYGEQAIILRDVNLRVDPEDRIAIVGTNGQGKTTLVKSIAKKLELMAGQCIAPGSIKIGYFSQDQMDELVPGDTVYDHVLRAMPKGTLPGKARGKAAQLGFSVEKVETKVEKLSGGEKVRLLMGLMSMEEPHILILDEPTSHLDIDSREALIYALNDYRGAVLLITHDVYLAEGTADELWLVKDGKANVYGGNLDDYKQLVMSADRGAAKEKTKPAEVVVAAPAPKVDKSANRQKAAEARKAAAPLKKAADTAEKRLEKANKRIAEIDAELIKPGLSSDQMQTLMKSRGEEVAAAETAEMEWLEALEAYEQAVSED
ncbi:ABC-F family ATP-binding cassette domain-containing protein [Ponticaulis sp.]|uniref:ABC-F family ATP-binding cassette domain-containing protein n=1 Tax=Ponticaulis sp. TaxID=2020902 RepID=UPI000B6CBF5B|nr:ABC-F family ATP-binding cassette domain-containing protein [Ponticaulis sp.]MAI89153.1 glycosyl transferase family 1 [Ponticaulis sp.]OUY01150.1 MAG: glycosyl transferase family 1 [Hyphomonadaceae bacterium TMED5]|tara:strand:+ start:113797 stop:115707 length:1911 start_codon:yes stop_codon:yes gene_type:complete